MTKNEIIEAINATIIPNGQKGITAESLANLLIEMVNATPEGGSSSGSGQVVFYIGMPNEEFTEFTLTSEQQVHNAEMFKIIKESPIALNASIDVSDIIRSSFTGIGIDASGYKQNFLSITSVYVPKPIAETEGLQDDYIGVQTEAGSFRVLSNGTVMILSTEE